MSLTRRGLLAASGVTGLTTGLTSGLLAGCGSTAPRSPGTDGRGPRRFRYGRADDTQFADLRMPTGEPRATVALLHGGYWLPGYGADLMDRLANRFTALGFATWNIDYRRTGEGGGFPATLLDVAAAVERLDGPGLPRGLSENVVLLGHSAGGHLAAWAASRSEGTPGGAPGVALAGAISLAGVVNLTLAAGRSQSSLPVMSFMGGLPAEVPERYALADPTLLVPASCPVWVVHPTDDDVVPAEQSRTYRDQAKAAGAAVQRVVVAGDHSTVIDPDTAAFSTVRGLVDRATA